MKKEAKAELIEELKEELQATPHIYFTDSATMTVAHVNVLRKLCYERKIRYRVVKNTLIAQAIAAQKAKDFSALPKEMLKGFTGIFFEHEQAGACAKLIKEFRKRESIEVPQLKAACVEEDIYIGEEQLSKLAQLKSKQELIAELVMLLQSPMKQVISALRSGTQGLAQALQAIIERRPKE